MVKKTVALIILILVALTGIVNATEAKTTLEIVQKETENKVLDGNMGFVKESIIDSEPETGEVTVEIQLTNKQQESTVPSYDETEILIAFPEISPDENFQTNKQKALELASKVLEYNEKTKVGILLIGGPKEPTTNGVTTDSRILISPTNKKAEIENALNTLERKGEGYINVESAVVLAKTSFTNNVNKILVMLYDKVPNLANGIHNKVSYGALGEYNTPEEAVKAKNESIVKATKKAILSLKSSNINFLLIRPEDTSFDQRWVSTSTGALVLEYDGTQHVLDLYGTLENPTYGKMYSLAQNTLDEIVNEYMYKDIVKVVNVMKEIKLVEHFSAEIMDNFEFKLIGSPNMGQTNGTIENNSISWEIEELEQNQVAKLQYQLKLKDMKNVELMDKVVATHTKLEINYTDTIDNYAVTVTDSPKVQLKEVKEVVPPDDGQDDTKAPVTIPAAGISTMIITGCVGVMIVAIGIFVKSRKYKDI